MFRWLLANFKPVCAFFTVKAYPHSPTREWWLVSEVAPNFLLVVNITFSALQTDSAVFSEQYDNVRLLLQKLEEN